MALTVDSPGVSGPANYAAAITPDDNADLTTAPRALWIGGAVWRIG